MHSNNINKILIVGAGAFGRALAAAIQGEENEIHFLVRSIPEVLREIKNAHIQFKGIKTFEEFDGNLNSYNLVIFAIPTQSLREVLCTLKNKYDTYLEQNNLKQTNLLSLVSTSKGIEQNSVKLPHEIFNEIFGSIAEIATLSGPSFAKEMLQHLPTCLTVASSSSALIQKCVSILHSPSFRLYDTEDIIGVEVGGALKNIIALVAGIVDGLGLGHNAKAAIITLGLSDIAHIGVRMGASPFTFMGLSGLGDLILTCTGDLSRNNKFGQGFAKTGDKEKVIHEMGGVVEGFATTKSAYQLMKKLQISSTLLNTAYKILYEDLLLEEGMKTLLNRKQGSEFRWLKEYYGSQLPKIRE